MSKLKNALVLTLAITMCATGLAAGCGGDTSGEGDAYRAARKTARDGVWKDINSGKACSASVAIMDGDRIVYAEGIGTADRSTGKPVDEKTLFNVGSVSKTHCAAAVMKLVDDGKVELDAPVTSYLSGFKMKDPRYEYVTVRMLLNHSSGFPGSNYANATGYAFNDRLYQETLACLAASNLKAAPGRAAPYCNDGFTLSEMIVAEVSGQKYVDFLTDNILSPLGLTRTGVSVGQRPDAGIARFYLPDSGKPVPPETMSVLGAGGLSSTAKELVMFMNGFSNGGARVLSSESIDEMTSPHPSEYARAAMEETGVNPEMNYGLGFDLTVVERYKEHGIRVIGKGGDSDDYHSMMISVPDRRISVAVIEAGHGSNAAGIAYDILDSVLVAKGLMKAEKRSVAPRAPQPLPEGYSKFDGTYGGDMSTYMVSIDPAANVVNLTTMKKGALTGPFPLTYRDGNLYTATGTSLKLLSAAGRDVLLAAVDGAYMTMGQRLEPAGAPETLGPGLDGSRWLRRNVAPWESISQDGSHVVKLAEIPGMPGYVDFYGVKKLVSPISGEMATDAIRDVTELDIHLDGARKSARVSEYLYSSDLAADRLSAGRTSVAIGKEGLNEWLASTGDYVLITKRPSGGRVIVFDAGGDMTYDSAIDAGGAYVASGGFIELAGAPGGTFEIEVKPSAGSSESWL